MDESKKNMYDVVKFLKQDFEVKSLMVQSMDYQAKDPIDMQDKLYDIIKEISPLLEDMAKFCGIKDGDLSKKLDFIKNELINTGANPEKIKIFVKKYIADMSPQFVKDINENCVGYLLYKQDASIMKKATSINEMLHLIHSSFMADEQLYGRLPQVAKKQIKGGNVVYVGDETDVGKEIFNAIPTDTSSGEIDILSIAERNKTIMMLRDFGHATTIEIDTSNPKNYYVKYFVPKICNLDKVNNLMGVTKVKNGTNYARGSFEMSSENFGKNLFDNFIAKIPTDDDIEYNYDFER